MKRSVFLVIAAILALILGVNLSVRPVHMMFMFDVGLDPSGLFMARMLGAAMIALAITYFIARSAPDSAAMSGILWGGLFQNVLWALLAFRMMNRGWMDSLGWGIIVIHLLLAIGFLSYLIKKKPA